MIPITRDQFETAAKATGNPYWLNSWHRRWLYYEQAGRLALTVSHETVLEAGTESLCVFPGATVVGFDLREPFPVADKAFDLFIALQVWEHLEGRQVAAFAEVRRIAGAAVLSVPYCWTAGGPEHEGIDMPRIVEWAGGVKPCAVSVVTSRAVCLWRFGK